MFRVLMLSADVMKNPMGGLGEHVRELSLAMVKRRPDTHIDLITPTYGKDYKIAENITQRYGLRLMRTKPQLRKSYMDIFRQQAEIVASAMKLPRPHLVHAHDWSSFDVARLMALHHNVPLVVTVHLAPDDLVDPVHQDHIRFVYEHIEDMQHCGLVEAHGICHVSQHYMNRYSNNFIAKSRVVGNGIDPNPWMEEHEPWVFPGTRPKKLVYIGRLASMKNVDTLVHADLPDDVDLCIVGGKQGADTNIHDEVRRVAEKRDQVHLLGPLYGKDKCRVMKSATAGIFPSRREPFGIVGLEWMLAQTPFAASYQDGMTEYLEEDIALHCGTTESSISECIRKLTNMSEEEKEARCQAGLKKALGYSWDEVARKTLEVYKMASENFDPTYFGCGHAPLPGWISGYESLV